MCKGLVVGLAFVGMLGTGFACNKSDEEGEPAGLDLDAGPGYSEQVKTECKALCDKACAGSSRCKSGGCEIDPSCMISLRLYVKCASEAPELTCIQEQPAAESCTSKYKALNQCITDAVADSGPAVDAAPQECKKAGEGCSDDTNCCSKTCDRTSFDPVCE